MAKKYEAKDMSGTLFKNSNKKTDRHPSLTGKALIDGTEYRISAWKNTPKDGGDPYYTLAFQIPETKSDASKKPAKSQSEEDDFML